MFPALGRWCFRHRRLVLGGWLVALVTVLAVAGLLGPAFSDDMEVPESDTKDGFDVLDTYFGGQGGGMSGSIVFLSEAGVDDPEVQAAMQELFAEIDARDGVTVRSPYGPFGESQVATEGDLAGRVAYAAVDLDFEIDQVEAAEIGQEIRELEPEIEGLEVLVGGQALGEFEPPESELLGLAFAIVILILAFGSVLAMGLPIGVAVIGVGTGMGLIALWSNLITVPEFATTIGAMLGLGVGIDYALFIVTRYREGLHAGMSAEDATAMAMDTSGRAVVFAGITVVISLLGMLIIGLQFVTGLGISASTTVLTTMLASITLLPAFFGFAGERIERTRWRGLISALLVAVGLVGVGLGISPLMVGFPLAVVVLLAGFAVSPLKRIVPMRRQKPLRETFWYRWSRVVQNHPWLVAIVSTVLLLLMALPVLGLRMGFSDESNFQEETDTRQAYDLLGEAFGPGFNGPFIVAVEIEDPADGPAIPGLVATLGAADGVAAVEGPFPNDMENPAASEAAMIRLIPSSAPQDEATEELVETLRSDVIPGATEGLGLNVYVTGFSAAASDFTEYLSRRTLLFFAAVLTLSFLLLMVVFRSLLVPLKAVIMNVLSIMAAYGVTVAVFQWGYGKDIVGIGQGAPVEPFIPMMMFAIVFGLSMDYEVFLLSRVREEYDKTGDAVNSVADGLAATARVISAAAAIMIVVFGSFVFEENRVVKMFGFGLAVAVFLDATLVRMLLVPATMELLGDKNWWLPKWLDRILPNVQIEGRAHEAERPQEPESAPVPVPALEAGEPEGTPVRVPAEPPPRRGP